LCGVRFELCEHCCIDEARQILLANAATYLVKCCCPERVGLNVSFRRMQVQDAASVIHIKLRDIALAQGASLHQRSQVSSRSTLAWVADSKAPMPNAELSQSPTTIRQRIPHHLPQAHAERPPEGMQGIRMVMRRNLAGCKHELSQLAHLRKIWSAPCA
jgi:hypothetical protein